MSQIPKPFEIYKHFKGNLYQIINVAEHSETGEKLVIYQALYGEYKLYARPLESFTEVLDKAKYPAATQMFRFELCDFQESAASQSETEHRAENRREESQSEESPNEMCRSEECETEELHIDPMVMRFLDASTYEEKMQILTELQYRVTDDMITTMAIACDVEVPDGKLEDRFAALRNCLATLERFECNRLR